MAIIIGVIGGSACSHEIKKLAFEVGCEIARKGALLICGGLFGVMENACKGTKSENGTLLEFYLEHQDTMLIRMWISL